MDGARVISIAHIDCLKHSVGVGHPSKPRVDTVVEAVSPKSSEGAA